MSELPFQLEDYVDNPVVLARIQAKVTQEVQCNSLNSRSQLQNLGLKLPWSLTTE